MKNTTKTNLLFYMLLPTIIIIIGVAVVTAETQTTIEDSNLFTFRTTAASGTQMIIPRITYLQGGDQSFYPYSQSGYILKPATYSGCSIQQICPSDTSHGPTCDDGESCGICLTYRDSETCDQGVTCEGSGYQTCEGTCIDATCTPICDETNNGFYTCDGTSNTCDGTDTCDGSPIDPHTCYGHTCHYTCVPGLTCEGIPDCNHTETWDKEPTCDGSPTCDSGETCNAEQTCAGFYTCWDYYTCDYGSTCDGAITCTGYNTCKGSTCNQASTCQGYTCDWTCGDTCSDTCSGWTSCGETCEWQSTCAYSCVETYCQTCNTCQGPTCEYSCDRDCTYGAFPTCVPTCEGETCSGPTCEGTCYPTCAYTCSAPPPECDPCDSCDEVASEVVLLEDIWYLFESPCPDTGTTTWEAQGAIPDYGEGEYFYTHWPDTGVYTVTICWEFEDCSDEVEFDAIIVNGDLEAYRPTTPPFQPTVVPENEEDTNGAGIRVNGDDDNFNGVPDNIEAPVTDEDDLIRVEVDGLPPVLPDGYEWVLRRSNTAIKLWMTPSKGFAELFGDEDVAVVEFRDWFIEWDNPLINDVTLELGVRKQSNGVFVASVDLVLLYRFHSIVIALGGEDQDPSQLPDPNFGTFNLAQQLYTIGYDVHMYDEDHVNMWGYGLVYNEAVSAIQNQDIQDLCIFGYSHGGGSTYDLCNRLIADQGTIGPFSIVFTSYVDAVENDGDWDMDQELRRPPGALYLVNHYQIGSAADWWLDGGPINPPGANFQLNVEFMPWGVGATHGIIDDYPQVISNILIRLLPRVPK